ncbi:hypothetical protein [Thomasclavelia sp.]|nr:hypothetical protein [Thomasclavelia sp.]
MNPVKLINLSDIWMVPVIMLITALSLIVLITSVKKSFQLIKRII